MTKNCERLARFQKNSSLGEIREEVDESESVASTEPVDEKIVLPKRFDFRFNNRYYIINISVDDKGERISTENAMQSRVVSNAPLVYHKPENDVDNSLPRHTIPIEA